MEEYQIEHIRANGAALIEGITRSAPFLEVFRCHNVLSKADLDVVNAEKTEFAKTKTLLDILETRMNAANVLIQALEETCQTGMLNILKPLIPSSSSSSTPIPTASSSSSLSSTLNSGRESSSPSPTPNQRPSSQQAPYHNNGTASRNQNNTVFVSCLQSKDPCTIHKFRFQSVEGYTIKIVSTLDTILTSQKMSVCDDPSYPIHWVSYPLPNEPLIPMNDPTKIYVVVTQTRRYLLNLLQEIGQYESKSLVKVIILTPQKIDSINITLSKFRSLINYPPPIINEPIFDDIKWSQLTLLCQEKLLEKSVNFQENVIPLGDICREPELLKVLDTSIIVQLLSDGQEIPKIVQKTAEVPPDFYISRGIQNRAFVVTDILKEAGPKRIFLISGHGVDSGLLERLSNHSVEVDQSHVQLSKDKITKYLLYLDESKHFREICKKVENLNTAVYWFEAHFNNKNFLHLEFKKVHPSTVDLSLIQTYTAVQDIIESNFGTEENIFLKESLERPDPVCIADAPGMGKSALLSSFAEQIKTHRSTRFVHYSRMSEFMNHLKDITNSRNSGSDVIRSEDIFQSICRGAMVFSGEGKFEKMLLQNWLLPPRTSGNQNTEIKCELMLDGLDEIVAEGQFVLVLGIIGMIRQNFKSTRLWLTFRSHMLIDVENKLQVMTCRLCPLSSTEQNQYLVNRWIQMEEKQESHDENWGGLLSPKFKTKLKQFAQFCLQKVKRNLEERGGQQGGASGLEITGNPLQCQLIGNVYFKLASQFAKKDHPGRFSPILNELTSKIGITELYKRIVNEKLAIYLRRENMQTERNSKHFVQKVYKQHFLQKHMQYAVRQLFPDEARLLSVTSSEQKDMDFEITNFGLISKFSNKKLEFVHRTYAEYFVARLIVQFEKFEGVSQANEQTIKDMAEFVVKTILLIPNDGDFTFTSSLWSGRQLKPPYFKHSTIVYFLNDMLNDEDGQPSAQFKREMGKAWKRVIEASSNPNLNVLRPPVFMGSIICNFRQIGRLQYDAVGLKEIYRKNTKVSHRDMINLAAEYGDLGFVELISEQIIGRKIRKSGQPDRTVADLFTINKSKYTGGLPELRPKSNPLYMALARADIKIVNHLVENQGFEKHTWSTLKSHYSQSTSRGVLHILAGSSGGDDESKIRRRLELIDFLLHKCGSSKAEILDDVDDHGRTPLLLDEVHIHIINHLVHRGADVFALDSNGNTLLHLLCKFEHFDHYDLFYKLLFNESADHDADENPIVRAEKFVDVYNFIMSKLDEGNTELEMVNFVNDLDDEERADFDKAYSIASALHFMGIRLIPEMKRRESRGEKWSKQNQLGSTPLHMAVHVGNLDAIRLMVGHLSYHEVNIEDNRGITPLFLVTQEESGFQMEIAKYLISHRANIHYGPEDPLLYGLRCGNPEKGVIEYLDSIRYPPDRVRPKEAHNKMLAALFKNSRIGMEKFTQLLEWIMRGRGSWQICKDPLGNGATLLHLAVKNLKLDFVQLIFNRFSSVDVNAKDGCGNTPLHLAYSIKSEEKIIYLLEKNADPYIKNSEDIFPKDYRGGARG